MTVLVTHDPLDALTLADELAFVRDGRVVQSGPPQQIVREPRDPYVAQVAGLNLYAAGPAHEGTLHLASGQRSSQPTRSRPQRTGWLPALGRRPGATSPGRLRPQHLARTRRRARQLTGQIARVSLTGEVDPSSPTSPWGHSPSCTWPPGTRSGRASRRPRSAPTHDELVSGTVVARPSNRRTQR